MLETANALSSMLEAHLLPLKVPMPNLTIKSPICEIHLGDGGLMQDVRSSQVPQHKLVSKHRFRPIREMIMAGVHPFLPSHPVLVDVERVDADLWFVE